MRGLVFDPRPARLALAGSLSRLDPLLALSGGGPLGLRELPDPAPPAPGWLTLAPRFAGVCGSDVTQATLQADWDNPLSGLVSFPHVMGHETVAEVLDPADSELATGELVVVNPWLGCAARGLPSCPACTEGMLPLCAHTGEAIPGVAGQGVHTGNIRGLPGGMGTRMVAHRSQLHRLPAEIEPAAGVLADPLAVGLHAAQRAIGSRGPEAPELFVVLGAGTIGLGIAAWLRQLGVGRVAVSTAWPYQSARVKALDARVLSHRPTELIREVAEATGARLSQPWRGASWLVSGGAAAVVDAVGSAATGELALAIVRPGGTVVRVGVGRARRSQTTLNYFKEVSVSGSNGYRTGDLQTSLTMLAGGDLPWRDWLTHRFSLGRWREAFRTAGRPERHGAVKVVIEIGDQDASGGRRAISAGPPRRRR